MLSIIIRSFNEERHIGRLLDGISRQQLPQGLEVEVIVVDSGSSDSTTAIAMSMGARIISISKEDFSFGRALNIGCAASNGDLLLFASAHVYPVYDDWIQKMITPFLEQKISLVYGRQVGNETTRFSEHQVFAKWFPNESNYNQLTPFCNNANCAIRKSLWSIQPFDEFLTGLEDLDWAHKIMEIGGRIVYEADAPVVHIHEESPSKIKNRYRREAIALKRIFPKVHFNYYDFVRLLISNSLSDFIHAIKKSIFLSEFKGILIFRFMQFYGTYLGHKQKGEISKELKSRFYYSNSIKAKANNTKDDPRAKRRIEYT